MNPIKNIGLGKINEIKDILKKHNCSNINNYCVVVFAGDNGISYEHTSSYTPFSSHEIVLKHLNKKSPTSFFLNRINKREYIVDIGLSTTVNNNEIIYKNIKKGTKNFLYEDALTKEEVIQAIKIGEKVWDTIYGTNFDIIGVGEIGVGDTICASAVVSSFLKVSPQKVVGRGSSDNKVLDKKNDIIKKALKIRTPNSNNIVDILARFGGLELASLVGFISKAAEKQTFIMLDGFVTTVAALLAVEVDNRCLKYLIASNLTEEIGHQIILKKLNIKPLIDLDLNYGEGLGSSIALFLAEMVTGINEFKL
ncbi:hypothetical protein SYNTR_1286 [Candidatus Syntrophocurvum alkaliphilum]|uniref:Nicotinate-nucleotide--dimethylbenzimidazole phosphoribosyltransferase n=1 Tax=Candidatus Syntrophocurvum alkaliphilum TaxID=2293317 RepID=A0A6I6DCA1_9FIRM|nr:nicotinate-nucleotide--dimethylbenzimidazole phosphoribosyltransferase [Candidatus Syntrophocurvum alkaliphilum]QGT99879.1 hypothetical protein SYNTR_1286 [Candidatus Syntrophocurvum alkaliphilum]